MADAAGHIPGTTTVDLPDGSRGRFVVHPTVLLAHTVRLQGAVNLIRGLLGDGEVDDADIAEAFHEWGV